MIVRRLYSKAVLATKAVLVAVLMAFAGMFTGGPVVAMEQAGSTDHAHHNAVAVQSPHCQASCVAVTNVVPTQKESEAEPKRLPDAAEYVAFAPDLASGDYQFRNKLYEHGSKLLRPPDIGGLNCLYRL